MSIISCLAIWVLPSTPFVSKSSLQSHLSLFALPAKPTFPNPLKNMASNRGQGGIQQLLAAEQEAQHIVNAARNGKMTRLKQAKDEAEKEVAEYRAQVEYEFQKKLTESSGDSGANVKRLERETDEKIHHLKNEASRISHDVVVMLLKQVTTVRN